MKRSFPVWLCLFGLLLGGAVRADETKLGRVVGRIDCQGVECNGLAALWRADSGEVPAPDRHLLIPAVVSALQEDGRFELIAPVGEYYAGAQLRRTEGPLFGAPRPGDRLYLIRPQDRQGFPVSVTEGALVDLGTVHEFWTYAGLTEPPQSGISGQVLTFDQQPVAGLLVFAFADPGATLAPLAVSARTGEDGRFVLPLSSSGPVYLRVRKSYRGGQPQAEDYVSASSADSGKPVQVEAGNLTRDVKLLVRKLPSVLDRRNAPNTARPKLN